MLRALAVLIARPWTADELSREGACRVLPRPTARRGLAAVGQDRGHPHRQLVTVGIAYSTGSVLAALPPRAWESKPLGYKVLGLLGEL